MKSYDDLNFDDSGEHVTPPVYEAVGAATLLRQGDISNTEAFTLRSGSAILGDPASEIRDLRPNERTVCYVRTEHEILRIEPNGEVNRLSLRGLPDRVKREPFGYIKPGATRVEIGEPLKLWYSYERDSGDYGDPRHIFVMASLQEPFGKVIEYLVRTNRPASAQHTDSTDTPLIYADPTRFGTA